MLIQSLAKVDDPSREKWSNQFNTYEECQSLCMHSIEESKASIDKSMPAPKAPKPWQCTDVPALKDLAQKNRSCLAYDNSKGYTYVDGECIPSDYSGCIDTYNKFKDIDLCTQSTFLTCVPTSFGHKSKKCHKRRNNSWKFVYILAKQSKSPFILTKLLDKKTSKF